MGSLRTGNVLNALSSGLGLFANKAAAEEQAQIDRDWDLTLANMREKSASARQKESYAHAESLATTREAGATARHSASEKAGAERYAATTEATSKYRSDTLSQGKELAQQKRVDDARENLSNNLLTLDKELAKRLEDVYEPEAQEAIRRTYMDLKDQAILSTVLWAVQQDPPLPGYDAKSEDGFRSLLTQHGMSSAAAADPAKKIWAMTNPPKGPGEGEKAPSLTDFLADPRLSYATEPTATSPTVPTTSAAPLIATPAPQQSRTTEGEGLIRKGGREYRFDHEMVEQLTVDKLNPLKNTPLFNEDVRAGNLSKAEEFLNRQRLAAGQ